MKYFKEKLYEKYLEAQNETSKTQNLSHDSFVKNYNIGFLAGIKFAVEMYEICFSKDDVLFEIMGVSQASEKWGLDPSTIKKMCAKKEIPARKIGDTWIMRSDQERPLVQRNYFVWKDYLLIGNTPLTTDRIDVIDHYDSDMLYFAAAHTIIRLENPDVKGNQRRSMKGSVIAVLRKIIDWEKFIYSADTTDTNDQIRERIVEKMQTIIDNEKQILSQNK